MKMRTLSACGEDEKKTKNPQNQPQSPNRTEKESKEDVGKQLTVERQDVITF